MAVKSVLKQKAFRSDAEAAFVGLLFVGARLMRRVEDACEAAGITHTQYNVLRILRGVYPEGHPRCEVAARLIDRAPDVTRILDRLENQGLVERKQCKENRRLSMARITGRGLTLLKEIDPQIASIQGETTGRLKKADQTALAALCDALSEML